MDNSFRRLNMSTTQEQQEQQVLSQIQGTALKAMQGKEPIKMQRSVVAIICGSFSEERTVTTDEPYLKGSMLGHDSKKFSGGKVINLYFPKSDAGEEAYENILSMAEDQILFVSGRIQLKENISSMNTTISVRLSDVTPVKFDNEGKFRAGEVELSGKPNNFVTRKIAYENVLFQSNLEPRDGFSMSSQDISNLEQKRQQQADAAITASFAPDSITDELDDADEPAPVLELV